MLKEQKHINQLEQNEVYQKSFYTFNSLKVYFITCQSHIMIYKYIHNIIFV
jgi:hypothetical protein